MAPLAPGVTEAGANVQPKSLGRPAHVKFTALLNEPDCGVTVTLTVPLPPVLRATAFGLAPKLKVGVLTGVVVVQLSATFTGAET